MTGIRRGLNGAPIVNHVKVKPPDPNRLTPAPSEVVKPKRRRNRSDRFELFNNFMDFIEPTLRPADRQVWLHLWRMADCNNVVECSFTVLQKRTGLSREHVNQSLKNLKANDLLTIVELGDRGGKPNRYQLRAVPKVVT